MQYHFHWQFARKFHRIVETSGRYRRPVSVPSSSCIDEPLPRLKFSYFAPPSSGCNWPMFGSFYRFPMFIPICSLFHREQLNASLCAKRNARVVISIVCVWETCTAIKCCNILHQPSNDIGKSWHFTNFISLQPEKWNSMIHERECWTREWYIMSRYQIHFTATTLPGMHWFFFSSLARFHPLGIHLCTPDRSFITRSRGARSTQRSVSRPTDGTG